MGNLWGLLAPNLEQNEKKRYFVDYLTTYTKQFNNTFMGLFITGCNVIAVLYCYGLQLGAVNHFYIG